MAGLPHKFWSLAMQPGHSYQKQSEKPVHICKAILETKDYKFKGENDIVQVRVQYKGETEVTVANLSMKKNILQTSLDLAFPENQEVTFSLTGAKVPVTLTGILDCSSDILSDDEEELSDSEEDVSLDEEDMVSGKRRSSQLAGSASKKAKIDISDDEEIYQKLVADDTLAEEESSDDEHYNPTVDQNLTQDCELEKLPIDEDETDEDSEDVSSDDGDEDDDEDAVEQGEAQSLKNTSFPESDEDSDVDIDADVDGDESDEESDDESDNESDDESEEESDETADESLVKTPVAKKLPKPSSTPKQVAAPVKALSTPKSEKKKEQTPAKNKKSEKSKIEARVATPKAALAPKAVKSATPKVVAAKSATPKVVAAKEAKPATPAAKENKTAKAKDARKSILKETSPASKAAKGSEKKNVVMKAGGVTIEDVSAGSGSEVKEGAMVSVYYKGTLKNNNKEFDAKQSGKPFKFRLGKGEVIKGWDIGVKGMKVGGRRKISVPPHMGYGKSGAGPIPSNAHLNFDVTLVGFN